LEEHVTNLISEQAMMGQFRDSKKLAKALKAENDALRAAKEEIKDSEKAPHARIADMQDIVQAKDFQITNEAATNSRNVSHIAKLE
jgi:hypothetical protein